MKPAPRPPALRDARTRRYRLPARILWASPRAVLRKASLLLTSTTSQAAYPPPPACVLPPGSSLLLDFGEELHGGLRLVTGAPPDSKPVPVRIRFGESAGEAMGTPNNDHALHDIDAAVPWCGMCEFGQTGFRFVRLDVRHDAPPLHLAALHAVELMLDIEQRGAFLSSDPRLNQLWATGARTVHLCMQDHIWDGIKRDRLAWMGDLYPEIHVAAAVFGDHPIVRRSLDWCRDTTPLPRWMNTISTYSMWWIVTHRDWHRFTGDRPMIEAQRPYLLALLKQLMRFSRANGPSSIDSALIDHPSSRDPAAVQAGARALLVLALEAGAQLCTWLPEPATAIRCRQAAARLVRSAPVLPVGNKPASALYILAGLADAASVNRHVLAADPCRGLSPFAGHWILEARAAAGDHAGCLDLIRRYWGGMLDLGATAFWEHFDIDWTRGASRIDALPRRGRADVHRDRGEFCYTGWRHSLCHGWSAGPTAWLSRHVLGVQPLEPGCRRVRIKPHLADMDWAEGRFPTPRGDIVLRHERKRDGRIRSSISLPRGIRAVG